MTAADRRVETGQFLPDVRVGFGGRGEVRRALAVAVPGPALQHGGGALCCQYARANGDDVHGEGPRPQRGPERRVSRAPRAQLAIGRVPRVHVHKRRRRLVDRQGKFQVEVARDLGCSGWPIVPRRQRTAVDAERLEPLHLVVLGREPCEGRPLDKVIEREQAAHEYGRRRVLPSNDQLKNHIRCVALSRDASRYLFTVVDEA